jgi:hypothetical protein
MRESRKPLSLLLILLLFVLCSTGYVLAQEKAKDDKPAEGAEPVREAGQGRLLTPRREDD